MKNRIRDIYSKRFRELEEKEKKEIAKKRER